MNINILNLKYFLWLFGLIHVKILLKDRHNGMMGEKTMSLKKNLDVVVYEKLWEKIIRGEWALGQFIAVDELADEYGVSRTPVLQALRRMEANRMITITSTGHHTVPTFTEKQLQDLFEMRMLLELQTIRDIKESPIPIPLTTLRDIAEKCFRYNQAGDTVRARENDLLFHTSLTEAANNTYLTDLYLRIQGQFMVANYLIASHTQEQERIAADDHMQILSALETGDFEEAGKVMRAHISGALDKLLCKIRT